MACCAWGVDDMNPSGIGGLLEGISGGVRDMGAYMARGKQLKREREDHAANMRLDMGFRFYETLRGNPEAQKKALEEYVLPAFSYFSEQGTFKYPKEQIASFFKDIDMGNSKSKAFLDSAANIFKQHQAGKLSHEEALDVFDTTVGTYQGELTGRQDEYLKQKRAKHVQEGRRKDMERLFKGANLSQPSMGPMSKPSALMGGLTEAYGAEAAGGISAATRAGTPLHQAASMFPKKKTEAAPVTPMYKDMQLPDGKKQAMRWNPKTKQHDIPFGKPKAAKEGHYFRLGHNYYRVKDGESVLIQEGSLDEKATMNAMKEFGWSMMSESDQVGLVAKHKRILTGKSKPAAKEDTERTNAAAAIEAGIDPETVKAMYKQRTGKEY